MCSDGNRNFQTAWPVRGLTLVELLVVMAILGILFLLLLPAVLQALESARATSCRNNLKQIGLGILEYEAAHGHLPKGAEGRYDRAAVPNNMVGFSWWVDVLPYLGESQAVDQLDHTGHHVGLVLMHEGNGEKTRDFAPSFWFCPSTPAGKHVTVGRFRMATPSYVGISGASNHNGFHEERVSPCCRSDGEISAGGLLIPNDVVQLKEIVDGLSTTILVGEQSDFAYTNEDKPRRIDGGHTLGWIAGTRTTGVPPEYGASDSPSYNLATVRYRLNERRYELPGVWEDRGANNPLISPHVGTVHLLYCDGTVAAVDELLPVETLQKLATRDDGQVAGK
jgi:prepilin-type N-terminal cleavage/methylation domain-containing protein